MNIPRKLVLVLVSTVLLLNSGFSVFRTPVHALAGNEFNAGRIIDDFVFFNPTSMTTQGIQQFLNAKVPVCDTNGDLVYSGTTTRKQYSISKGYSPPYTCLKDYHQTTTNKLSEPNLCNGYTASNQSSAEIIFGVSQSCGINPRVLLVLIQKEQSLVTDDWPWSIQYRSATGFGCPDTAPCDAQYYGFFNQVYAAARQFKYYAQNSSQFGYKAGRNNFILYNPNSACNGSTVFIQNQATAGLYNYTPYQPNQAALNNLYGSGDSCSAYGNRNFWRIYNDWFGPTNANCDLLTMNGRVFRLYNPKLNDYLYTTSNIEVCMAQSFYGYVADDFVFTVTPVASGGVPIYRLTSTSNHHFYTNNVTEKNNLVNSGDYSYDGIAFTAKPTATTGYSPVYRMAPKKDGSHIYTPSASEKDSASGDYLNEGVMFYTPTPTSSSVFIYRLRTPIGAHFYTKDLAEKNNAITNLGYVYEGVSFKAQPGYTPQTIPVYRLLSWPYHVFSPSRIERRTLLTTGYSGEGIAFYAATNGTMPVYRLYRHTDGDHLLTTSKYEKEQAVINAGYIYEGVTFYSL